MDGPGHSGCGRLAWQAVFLKSRYPAEFMAAVLANEGGFYEARAYLEEARRFGVKILLPDVNRSSRTYRAMDGGLRIGLGQVRVQGQVVLVGCCECWRCQRQQRQQQPAQQQHDGRLRGEELERAEARDARLKALASLGITATACERLHGPVGLIPSARDPSTLAVSVLAEVLAKAMAGTT